MVHNPNLDPVAKIPALAAQEDIMTADMTLMQRLAASLKLAPDADAETILSALEQVMTKGATPDPKDCAPVAAPM